MARLGFGLGMMALAVGFAIIGGVLCLWAGYQWLLVSLGQPLAALLIGLVSILVAGACAWAAQRLTG